MRICIRVEPAPPLLLTLSGGTVEELSQFQRASDFVVFADFQAGHNYWRDTSPTSSAGRVARSAARNGGGRRRVGAAPAAPGSVGGGCL